MSMSGFSDKGEGGTNDFPAWDNLAEPKPEEKPIPSAAETKEKRHEPEVVSGGFCNPDRTKRRGQSGW